MLNIQALWIKLYSYYLFHKTKNMSITLNGLFDDFSEYFGKGKKSLDQEITEALKGKQVNKKEFKKDGQTIVEESYSDGNITYYSKKTFIVDDIAYKEDNIKVTKDSIQRRLFEAIEEEDFEEAAKMRDELKKYK